MADWNTVRYDPAYEEKIDPEILPLCDAMNAAGFTTTDSCCGHGRDWPRVWFEHSDDERIEELARFVMTRNEPRFFSVFRKEILEAGYLWSLEIHLNDLYADTSVEEGLKEAVYALGKVTEAVATHDSRESVRP